ncbi:MAG: hypothetical protein CL681_04710 [Blastopirellula sp.]|mgnify:CR=1 FL=1|nr:hypothetical protein [Blastopirellula sp.]
MRHFALLALCLTLLSTRGPHAHAQQIVWSDEFNGPEIDRRIWTYDVGGHGFGNGQLEYNTARRENSYIQDGHLVLEARREAYQGKAFTSARMLTLGRFAFQYGTLEARIKVPDTANGVWPAFWMLGNNFPAIEWPKSGETDILEIGGKDGIAQGLQQRRINCALHFAGPNGNKISRVSWFNAPTDLHRDFHVYRLSWTPQRMQFFLDDQEYGSWDITAAHFSEFHQPQFLLCNLAVGSWTTSYTGLDQPDKITAKFPSRMYVDWIRLKSNPHTKIFLGDRLQQQGALGVYTESPTVKQSIAFTEPNTPNFDYGEKAALLTWNNMQPASTTVPAFEGQQCWSYDIQAGDWFGMGVLLPNYRNMQQYSDGFLHFAIRSKSPARMRVGIKSSHGGEFWLPLGDEQSEFGFARDGKWHAVKIPLNRYANTDFQTIHQLFMLSGDAPTQSSTVSIDNVWWEPSVPRKAPAGGNFGIFTENAAHQDAGHFARGQDGNFFIWENTFQQTKQNPLEGQRSLSLQRAANATWCGAAWTPNVKYDLTAFNHPQAQLHFAMKTSSNATFLVGMKSGNVKDVGQKWIRFSPGNDPYGFQRDGKWHVVEIPLTTLATEIDLTQVSQLFQILSTDGKLSAIELDDICLLGGKPARRP